MSVKMYEQRPPTAIAVIFDGSNAAEVAELADIDTPEVTTGGAGDPERALGQPIMRADLYGWGPEYAAVIVAGDYLVRHSNGALSHMQPDTFLAQFREVAEG